MISQVIVGSVFVVTALVGQTSEKPQHLKVAVKIADKSAERCGLRFDSLEPQIEACVDTIRIAKPFEKTIEASLVLKTVNNEPDGALTIIGTFEARDFDKVDFLMPHERLTIDAINKTRKCVDDQIDARRKAHDSRERSLRKSDKNYTGSDFVVPHELEHERDAAQVTLNETTPPIMKSAAERKTEAETVTVTLTIPAGAEIDVDRTDLARAKRAIFHFKIHEFSVGLPYEPPLHERIPARIIAVNGEVLAVNPKKSKTVVDAGE